MSKERELLKRFMTELKTEDDVVSLFNDIKECLALPEQWKPECCICKTNKNVEWAGGFQAYRCDSKDCIPF